VLDQAAEAQLADGRPRAELLVGQLTDGRGQGGSRVGEGGEQLGPLGVVVLRHDDHRPTDIGQAVSAIHGQNQDRAEWGSEPSQRLHDGA
jgi:hypothetical protein